jgi:hypothetical protein
MNTLIKKLVNTCLRQLPGGTTLLAVRLLLYRSHLREAGWFNSFERMMPEDGKRQAVPWYTYCAIRFLSDRVKASMTIFEYGSGNSTLWWAARTARTVSYEHDREWHKLMRDRLPPNVEYHYCDLLPKGDYARQIERHHGEFDIVVIDGRDRVNCAMNSLPALNAGGVIIWDNTDRAEYQAGYDFLAMNGFRRIDFWGMGPINAYGWCTSVFYRANNCLGI